MEPPPKPAPTAPAPLAPKPAPTAPPTTVPVISGPKAGRPASTSHAGAVTGESLEFLGELFTAPASKEQDIQLTNADPFAAFVTVEGAMPVVALPPAVALSYDGDSQTKLIDEDIGELAWYYCK